MRRFAYRLPLVITVCAAGLMILHGPIVQPPHYHDFADSRAWFGIPNAADVLSNLGFALAGLAGLHVLHPVREDPRFSAGCCGYALFFGALILTAVGSTFYHLAPDNERLLWDRLPIALACAGLLAAVHAETVVREARPLNTLLLAVLAVASGLWWRATDLDGSGDLRPYLLLQALPIVLIPLWHRLYDAPAAERRAFIRAIVFYGLAKLAELFDHELMRLTWAVSGHTLKHLLATAAAIQVVICLARRRRPAGDSGLTLPSRRRSRVRGSCG